MTKKLKTAMVAAAAAALLAMPAAHAEFYVGFGVGGAAVKADPADMGVLPVGLIPPPSPLPPGYEEGVAGDQAAVGSNFSDTDLGTLFVVGWRAKYFGFEVGYANFNQMSRSEAKQNYTLPNVPLGCTPGISTPGSTGCQEREWRATYASDGYQAAVLGYLPVGDSIELFGKAGAIVWDSEQSGAERIREFGDNPSIPAPRNSSIEASDDGTDFMVGVGVNFLTDSAFTLRVAADYYAIGNTDRVVNYTASVVYSWGGADK
jgi:hypothetical protein